MWGLLLSLILHFIVGFFLGGGDLNSTKWDKFKVWGDAQSSAPA